MKSSDSIRLPALFVGHGNPMNAFGDNEFARGWRSLVEDIPKPEAILCISAHWEANGSLVNTTRDPRTIHDFYGFPEALYRMEYPCPGFPDGAPIGERSVKSTSVGTDPDRGLDHGVWAVLCHMYPEANIPVFELSLDAAKPPEFHYQLGRELAPLRDEGILIVGSGNLVHNLMLADLSGEGEPYPWAEEFDTMAAQFILGGEDERLIDYDALGQAAQLSVPTDEHYLPLLYILGMRDTGEDVTFVNEKIVHRSVGMRSVRFG
jgi:4,5-DOPA dioxygenase extradiol